jgi:hypothetical protein
MMQIQVKKKKESTMNLLGLLPSVAVQTAVIWLHHRRTAGFPDLDSMVIAC